jgi:hypothetical protein
VFTATLNSVLSKLTKTPPPQIAAHNPGLLNLNRTELISLYKSTVRYTFFLPNNNQSPKVGYRSCVFRDKFLKMFPGRRDVQLSDSGGYFGLGARGDDHYVGVAGEHVDESGELRVAHLHTQEL